MAPPPIVYVPGWFADTAAEQFAHLQQLPWVRHGETPRMEYYTNDLGAPYTYGRAPFARTYQPQDLAPVIRAIRDRLAEHALLKQVTFEVCFLNRYLHERDHLGWHADDSPEMDDARPIAIVSFGAERNILFRANPVPGEQPAMGPTSVRLGHGSLCIMLPGMQDTHQHRLPKHGAACGERISLTFRGYTPS